MGYLKVEWRVWGLGLREVLGRVSAVHVLLSGRVLVTCVGVF